MERLARAGWISIVLIASACSGPVPVGQPPATASPVTTAALATATDSGSTSVAPTGTVASAGATVSPTAGVNTLAYGNLDPGTYRPANFSVPMTFTTQGGADGIAALADDIRYLELRPQRNLADAIVFLVPSSFFAGGKGLFDSLEQQNVSLSEVVPVNIGGLDGKQAEFVAPKVKNGFGVLVATVSDKSLFEDLGYHARVVLIPRGDSQLVILVDAPNALEFDAATKIADELFGTLHFD